MNENKQLPYLNNEKIEPEPIASKKVVRKAHDMSFVDYIRVLSDGKLSKSGEIRVKTRELSERVGIDYEMFRKILNRRKPNQPRDCIIAICAALFCSAEETNKALFYYDDMPGLDFTEGCRDFFIMQALEGNIGKENDRDYISKGVELVNETLKLNEFSLLRLSNKTKTEEANIIAPNDRIEDIISEAYSLREKYYSSLGIYYKPDNYSVTTQIKVLDNKKIHHLVKKSNTEDVFELKYDERFPTYIRPEADLEKKYESILDDSNKRELSRCYEVMFDTKNWGFRKSAKLKDESIVVYGEQFNHKIPERHEYFCAEINNGQFKFSVLNNSMFMKEYLTVNEFKNYYSHKQNGHKSELKIFYSIEEIKEYFKKNHKYFFEVQYSYLSYFTEMKKSLEELLNDIKNKKQFIRDYQDLLGDDPNMIFYFFEVENEFECFEKEKTFPVYKEYDPFEEKLGLSDGIEIGTYLGENKYVEIVCKKEEAIFEIENKKMILTREDLITAFELGINNIEEVIKLKHKILDFKKIYE